jgi:hypothetical protein
MTKRSAIRAIIVACIGVGALYLLLVIRVRYFWKPDVEPLVHLMTGKMRELGVEAKKEAEGRPRNVQPSPSPSTKGGGKAASSVQIATPVKNRVP